MDKSIGKRTTEELFREYRETESQDIRNEIVERYLYIAEILARKYSGRGVDYDDLYQVASYALVMAVTRFDPDKNYQITSYATATIIGEIKNYFRDTMWSLKVPRRLKETSSRILEAKKHLQEKNGYAPTVPELAEYLEASEEEIIEALESSMAFSAYSLDHDAAAKAEETFSLERFLNDEEKGYERLETSGVIERVVAGLSPTEKRIIQKRFLQEITQREVAKSLGVSQMTVSRIEKAMIEKFRNEYNR